MRLDPMPVAGTPVRKYTAVLYVEEPEPAPGT
jgi:hypothetical protein